MDVGCWLVKKLSANLLKNCINPVWGLLYSNGTSLYLMPVSSATDYKYLQPRPLQFENLGLIHDISWSPPDQYSQYVAIISSHETGLKITVWKAVEQELSISFSEVNHSFLGGQPLPQGQGLAWHPQESLICIVCQNEATVFQVHEERGMEKIRSFSGRERFTTCCWNYSGSLLIFATQSKLLFYRFTHDAVESVEPIFSFVVGRACSLETVDHSRLLCAVELPLSDVIRNHGEQTAVKEISATSPLEQLMNIKPVVSSIVASSQLLLLGYNASDWKPHIISRIDIQEILTPNIMVFEKTSGLCIIGSNSSSKLQFFSVEKGSVSRSTEMVLEKGKQPKGVAVSLCNNYKLLWLLSGQSCQDCCASLIVPDKGYISCNMTFRVIALEPLLGQQQKYIIQGSDMSGCLDSNRNVSKSIFPSLPTSVPSKESSIESNLGKTEYLKNLSVSNEGNSSTAYQDQESDDKSIQSYYSAESTVPTKKSIEIITSSSNEDFYSIEQMSLASKSSTIQSYTDRKMIHIEKCISDISKKQTSELQEIKSEILEIKNLLLTLSAHSSGKLKSDSAHSDSQTLDHLQQLQKSVHVIENKVDHLSMDIDAKMKKQEETISDIRKELDILNSKCQ